MLTTRDGKTNQDQLFYRSLENVRYGFVYLDREPLFKKILLWFKNLSLSVYKEKHLNKISVLLNELLDFENPTYLREGVKRTFGFKF